MECLGLTRYFIFLLLWCCHDMTPRLDSIFFSVSMDEKQGTLAYKKCYWVSTQNQWLFPTWWDIILPCEMQFQCYWIVLVHSIWMAEKSLVQVMTAPKYVRLITATNKKGGYVRFKRIISSCSRIKWESTVTHNQYLSLYVQFITFQ